MAVWEVYLKGDDFDLGLSLVFFLLTVLPLSGLGLGPGAWAVKKRRRINFGCKLNSPTSFY